MRAKGLVLDHEDPYLENGLQFITASDGHRR